MESTINFKSPNGTLYGILGEPDAAPHAAVVFIHGWSGCRCGPHRIYVEAARRLNAQGVATLRFDLSGRGESEGDWQVCGLDEMIDDTSAAVDFLRARWGALPVVLWGMCSGGNVAIGTATLRGDIRHLVTWSTFPFQTHRTAGADARRTGGMLKEYARKLFRAQTWKKLARGAINFRMIWKVLFGHFGKKAQSQPGDAPPRNLKDSRRDIMSEFERYKGAVLFLYGTGDAEGRSGRLHYEQFAAASGLDARFEDIPGANHNFYSVAWKRDVIERSVAWVGASVAGHG